MTEAHDDRMDLTLLGEEATTRASRITARLAARVAAARQAALQRRAVLDGAQRRLARLAIPAGLAAAAALAALIVTTRTPPPISDRPEPFAEIVMGPGPAARWIALDRRPDIAELVTMVGGTP